MKQFKSLIKTSLLGGIVVILPSTIMFLVFSWIFKKTTGLIQPLTSLLIKHSPLPEIFADLIVILIILIVCFFVGIFVRTRLGTWIYHAVENNVLKVAPGYTLVKETVLQFLGNKKSPFSTVVLARIFNNDTLATAFVTDFHDNGMHTIFVPTGPNPTSGNIYHIHEQYLYFLDVSVEETMKSIIGCGAGSNRLILAAQLKRPHDTPRV